MIYDVIYYDLRDQLFTPDVKLNLPEHRQLGILLKITRNALATQPRPGLRGQFENS